MRWNVSVLKPKSDLSMDERPGEYLEQRGLRYLHSMISIMYWLCRREPEADECVSVPVQGRQEHVQVRVRVE